MMSMTSGPLVSVIVPLYNSELFLEDCIFSVVNQKYKCVEIIIVNDGSTDRSAEILDKWAHLDRRIIPIHKQNEGPAIARQKGVDIAKGKYIQFLDSDDTLLPDAIEVLVEKAECTDADIVAFPFFFCEPRKSKHPSASLTFSELNGLEYLKEILNCRAAWSLWSNFQKRSFLQSFPMELVPGILCGEDAIWMTQLLLHQPKVVSVGKALLNYNWNPSSLSNSESIKMDRNNSFRGFQRWMENYIAVKGMFPYFEKDLALQQLRMTFTCIAWGQLQNVDEDMKRAFRNIKKIPELKKTLSRRQHKLIVLYCIASFIGRAYLMNCIKKRKSI